MKGLVVVGASYAGIQAALSAREGGYDGAITVISDEQDPPYHKPPLSKGFLLGLVTQRDLILRDLAFLNKKQIDVRLGARATTIDRSARELVLDDRARFGFSKLVVATGSRARILDVDCGLDGVAYLRSLRDANDLKPRFETASRIVVVGGGFIGLEVAASAAKAGKSVCVIEGADRLLGRAVPPFLSDFLLEKHRSAGVTVRFGTTVAAIDGRQGHVTGITLSDGSRLEADLVLVGVGGLPNEDLALECGLNCDSGIIVDQNGMTSDPDIYAAGDCARHYNAHFGGWVRLESVQNAQDQARTVGMAVANVSAPYDSVPRFWSDQYDLKLQMVGCSSGFTDIAVRGHFDDQKFSIFYYKRDRLIGVDSVNRPGDQMAAKRLLTEGLSPSKEAVSDASFDFKSMSLAEH